MDLISKLLSLQSSSCVSCGSLWSTSGDLCQACFHILQRYKAHISGVEVQKLKVHSLYDWTPQKSDGLSRLLIHTKKKNSPRNWNFFAAELFRELGLNSDFLKADAPLYVVPAPPRRPNQKDHAYNWGRALSEVMGGELAPCLVRMSDCEDEQKKKNLFERSLLQMEIAENYTNWPSDWKRATWIFADDIVTTGATAGAAFRALGSPTHFYVAALAYRRSLAAR